MSAKFTTKQRLQIERQKMTEQAPLIRNANFDEVNLGLPEKIALLEAERCLQCKDPKCVSGCPVMVSIPRFIQFLSDGNLAGAAQSLLSDNALPSVTGRVCPQETQCEVECIRGHKGLPVAVGYLERYVGDWARGHSDGQSLKLAPPSGKKVAVVGSGSKKPASRSYAIPSSAALIRCRSYASNLMRCLSPTVPACPSL